MMTPFGSFAEYAIAPATTTFDIPQKTSFEETATIPLAAMTAAVGLFCSLALPEPWLLKPSPTRDLSKGGIIIYGAASAVGAYAIKLLVKAELHPIICVAGRGIDFVEGLIDCSKGDTIVDYRDGDEAVVKGLAVAVPSGKTCHYAFDAVSEKGSFTNIVRVLDPQGHILLVLPGQEYLGIPNTVTQFISNVGSVHNDNIDFGYAWFRLFGLGLAQGWFSGHPYEVIPGGLSGVEAGLQNLMNGKASAVKFIFKIEDTKDIEKSEI